MSVVCDKSHRQPRAGGVGIIQLHPHSCSAFFLYFPPNKRSASFKWRARLTPASQTTTPGATLTAARLEKRRRRAVVCFWCHPIPYTPAANSLPVLGRGGAKPVGGVAACGGARLRLSQPSQGRNLLCLLSALELKLCVSCRSCHSTSMAAYGSSTSCAQRRAHYTAAALRRLCLCEQVAAARASTPPLFVGDPSSQARDGGSLSDPLKLSDTRCSSWPTCTRKCPHKECVHESS